MESGTMALPNLPLPRELRDQIYGYLLDSTYTRVIRHNDNPIDNDAYHTSQAYKFHTNILAVNHAIHDEAEEYLYKNNIFIVASFEWPKFATGQFGGMIWTPLVNTNHVVRMRHHSLRLHFTPTWHVKTSSPGYHAGDKIPVESFLLLRDDFHALCNTMRYHVGFLPGFTIAIADNPSHRPAIMGVGGIVPNLNKAIRPASLKIQFCDTQFRTMDGSMQKKMLDELSKISCASMRVTITGNLHIEGTDYIRRTQELMGPVLLSNHAAMWANYEIMVEAKYLTDGIVRLGELSRASSFYVNIYRQVDGMLEMQGPLRQSLVNGQKLDALRFDVLCTLGYLEIKTCGAENVVDIAALLARWARSDLWTRFSRSEEASFRHLCILCDLYLPDSKARGNVSSLSVGRAVGLLSKLQQKPHIMHDLAILEIAPKDESALKYLPVEKCGAFRLPIPHFSSHQNQHLGGKPDHLVGRQNMEAQRLLEGSVKEEINRIQTRYGQKITEWQ